MKERKNKIKKDKGQEKRNESGHSDAKKHSHSEYGKKRQIMCNYLYISTFPIYSNL